MFGRIRLHLIYNLARGLDFGCGPGPALTLLMEEAGFAKMNLYDPFYFADEYEREIAIARPRVLLC